MSFLQSIKVIPMYLEHRFFFDSCFQRFFFFFNVDSFKSLYWVCYNIASVLCFAFFPVEACGILVHNIEFGNVFLDRIAETQTTKVKINWTASKLKIAVQ